MKILIFDKESGLVNLPQSGLDIDFQTLAFNDIFPFSQQNVSPPHQGFGRHVQLDMIRPERQIPSIHFYLSMSLKDLGLSIIGELIDFNVHRPFCFHHAHFPYLGMSWRRIGNDEEEKKGT
jgi:hypothetical protein